LLRNFLAQCCLLLLLLLHLSMVGPSWHHVPLQQLLWHLFLLLLLLLLLLSHVTTAVAAACYPCVARVSSANLTWTIHSSNTYMACHRCSFWRVCCLSLLLLTVAVRWCCCSISADAAVSCPNHFCCIRHKLRWSYSCCCCCCMCCFYTTLYPTHCVFPLLLLLLLLPVTCCLQHF
jgi:hypothetical protein